MDKIVGVEEIRCLLYGRNDGRRTRANEARWFVVLYVEMDCGRLGRGLSPQATSWKESAMDRLQAELTASIAAQASVAYMGSHGFRSAVVVLSFPLLEQTACVRAAGEATERLAGQLSGLRIGISSASGSLHMLKHLLHQAEYDAMIGSDSAQRLDHEEAPSFVAGAVASTRQSLQHHHHAKVVERIKRHIREHLEHIETVEQLAAEFYFSPSYMNQIFKKHTGITIFDYIISSRMEAAKRMLTEPRAKACEVSLRLGYQNYSHFNTLFKQRTGMTPKQYSRKFG